MADDSKNTTTPEDPTSADSSAPAAKPTRAEKRAERETERAVKRAQKRAKHGGSASDAGYHKRQKRSKVPVILTGLVALAVGILLGRTLLGGYGNPMAGKTSLTTAELNQNIGNYTYKGQTVEFTAREVMESVSSVDNYQISSNSSDEASEATYSIPSASDCVSYIQNQIIYRAVDDEGIKVTDDEMDEYAQTYAGTSDYETLASNWNISEDKAKEIVRRSCGVYKLHEEKAGGSAATAPAAPSQPSEGQESTPTAEYGAYIVNLLGDEWDSDKNTWARTDGPFYQALNSESFSADSATYSQAEMAYYVAYNNYQTEYAQTSQKWTDYVNGLLSNTSIDLYTAVA